MDVLQERTSERTGKQLVRRIMEEIIKAVKVVYSAGDPLARVWGSGGLSIQTAGLPAVPVLTMTKVSICKVFEIVLGWRGGELDISPLYAGCHAADVGWTARRPLCAWSKSSTFPCGQS